MPNFYAQPWTAYTNPFRPIFRYRHQRVLPWVNNSARPITALTVTCLSFPCFAIDSFVEVHDGLLDAPFPAQFIVGIAKTMIKYTGEPRILVLIYGRHINHFRFECQRGFSIVARLIEGGCGDDKRLVDLTLIQRSHNSRGGRANVLLLAPISPRAVLAHLSGGINWIRDQYLLEQCYRKLEYR